MTKNMARLPTELWTCVIGYISSKQDLARVCLVSSLFNAIALPFLYQRLNIRITNKATWDNQHSLLMNLRNPQFSDFITRFEISIRCGLGHEVDGPGTCHCDNYDEEFGRVLSSCSNLEALSFKCSLCPAYGRHSYLLNDLSTQKLKELKFFCSCTRATELFGNISDSKSLLTAPHMQTVKSLGLRCSEYWFIGTNGTIHNLLQNENVLPLLTSLCYQVKRGSRIFVFPERFLTLRPVTRLYHRGPWIMFTQMAKYYAKLDHLLVDSNGMELASTIARQPDAFAHLKYIGVFVLPSSKEGDVLKKLSALKPLKILETIEIDSIVSPDGDDGSGTPDPFEPSQSLFQRLGEEHPSLHRVHIVDATYNASLYQKGNLWERRRDGTWAGRVIPHLERWDTLNGMLDVV